MIHRVRAISALFAISIFAVACQATAPSGSAPTVVPSPAVAMPSTGAAGSVDGSDLSRPVEASSRPVAPLPSPTNDTRLATPVDAAPLEDTLSAVGCDGPNTDFIGMRIWGCPGSDGSYVVQLLNNEAGLVTDVTISPDFASRTPSDEVARLLTAILDVVAPNADMEQVNDAVAALDHFDAAAPPSQIKVGGWTVFLAPNEGTYGSSWTLGVGATR